MFLKGVGNFFQKNSCVFVIKKSPKRMFIRFGAKRGTTQIRGNIRLVLTDNGADPSGSN